MEDILVKAKQPLPRADPSAGRRVRTSASNLISETQLGGKFLIFPWILLLPVKFKSQLKGKKKNLKDSRAFKTNVFTVGEGVQGGNSAINSNFHEELTTQRNE